VNVKSVILTVVGRFSKYAHFIILGHPYTAMFVARAFLGFQGPNIISKGLNFDLIYIGQELCVE
jgi:hypothetical protein